MTTPTMTKDQLIDQVAFNLGALAEGQTIETDAYNRISERVGPVLLSLSTRGIVDIANENLIGTEFFLELADCVADACASVFGAPRDLQKLTIAEDRLALMARRSDSSRELLQSDIAVRGNAPFSYQRWLRGG